MPSAHGGVDHEVARMKCCCGRSDCAYLEHNNSALGGLERDLETAAKLGQALLSRHESYITESQAEQARMSKCISDLEAERLSLHNANERMVAENRNLLHRLERLNGDLVDSDSHVKRLENLLEDCELEVKRLTSLVRRTEELNNRIQDLEQERQTIHEQWEEDRDETRNTLARWRESERKVRQLEDDLHRIELEARQDREKHEEIVTRLERERNLERELSSAEGRLKGAAAFQSINTNEKGSKQVVTHFVRDILQDNANLQAGIAELRELLQSSNEEVQNLREQIMTHQPIEGDGPINDLRRHMSLDQELHSDAPSPLKHEKEVHVHHHYHTKAPKSRITMTRRPSKRRTSTTPRGSFSESSKPTTPTSKSHRFTSGPVAPLNFQQAQPPKLNRWSMQSTATMSSVLSSIPSSPRSYFDRRGSFFDRLERGEESSRPTSPESMADLLSPRPGQYRFGREKTDLDACEEENDQKETFNLSPMVESKPCFDVNELPTPSETDFGDELADEIIEVPPESFFMLQPQETEETIPEDEVTVTLQPQEAEEMVPEDEVTITIPNILIATPIEAAQIPTAKSPRPLLDIPELRPSLARKGSHETLVSISGMDIHIPRRTTPSTTLELLHRHFAHSPAQVRKVSAAQPLAEVTEYTAISSPTSGSRSATRPAMPNMQSSVDLLSGIAAPRPKTATRASSELGAIGRLGGWVRGKWGIAPTKSSGNLRAVAAAQASAVPPLPTPPRNEPAQRDTHGSEASNTVTAATYQNAETIQIPNNNTPDLLHAKVDPAILFAGRSPGINQPGFIPGFRSAVMNKRTPSQVMVSVIDEEGLREGLAE